MSAICHDLVLKIKPINLFHHLCHPVLAFNIGSLRGSHTSTYPISNHANNSLVVSFTISLLVLFKFFICLLVTSPINILNHLSYLNLSNIVCCVISIFPRRLCLFQFLKRILSESTTTLLSWVAFIVVVLKATFVFLRLGVKKAANSNL